MGNKYYDVFFELEKEKDLAQVLEDTIQCGGMPFEPKQYIGAFTLLTNQLYQHQENLKKLVDEGFEIMRTDNVKGVGVING